MFDVFLRSSNLIVDYGFFFKFFPLRYILGVKISANTKLQAQVFMEYAE